jgi:hypothetical protein
VTSLAQKATAAIVAGGGDAVEAAVTSASGAADEAGPITVDRECKRSPTKYCRNSSPF